jgi:hypothetical protein
MYGCLTSANYRMTADILEATVTQDPKTFQLKREYAVCETIKCYAESILTDSASDVASGKKFADEFSEYELINIKTGKFLSKRLRLTNIRGVDGEIIWPQGERPDRSMVFEVQGCKPILDPFGRVLEYQVMAKRVEIQDED